MDSKLILAHRVFSGLDDAYSFLLYAHNAAIDLKEKATAKRIGEIIDTMVILRNDLGAKENNESTD